MIQCTVNYTGIYAFGVLYQTKVVSHYDYEIGRVEKGSKRKLL